MKALLPVFCRPVGYLVLLIALFILPVLYIQGMVTDHNLLFYKECTKLLMMSGCLLIIFALSKNESRETEQIRNAAVRNARELLKDSGLSIKEICAESGYSDPNYFSRIFKKQMDMTPSEYKARYGK